MKTLCHSFLSIISALLLALVSFQVAYAAGKILVDRADDANVSLCTATANDCTLRGALIYANTHPGTTIIFAGNYTITLSSQLPTVTAVTTINGMGPTATIIQAAAIPQAASYRVMQVANTGALTLSGLAIRNGYSTGNGGGILNAGTLTLNNVLMQGNATRATGAGGAIFSEGSLTVAGSSFQNNHSLGPQGGAVAGNGAAITISGSNFISNSSTEKGGAIYVTLGSLNISGSSFTTNKAGSLGGALYSFSTNTSLSTTTFTQNTAAVGGAINNNPISTSQGITGSPLAITTSTFTGNRASSGMGGAINFDGCYGDYSITRSTFAGNKAATNGGAIAFDFLFPSSPCNWDKFYIPGLHVSNSTFYSNTANANGGGIYAHIHSFSSTNNTFSMNGAALGGGIYSNSHFTENNFYLYNTILANSPTGGDCYDALGQGDSFNYHNNLIESNGPEGHQCGSALLSADPKLGPLASNGGPTQTMALQPFSPALNQGDAYTCANIDQRGLPRPQGPGCDIGAYELQEAPAPFAKTRPTDNSSAQPTSLTLTWQAANGALRYDYCIDTSDDDTCTAPAAWVSNGSATSKAISALSPGTTYYWQVRAVNSLGTTPADSGRWWSFAVNRPPASFSKVSPANTASGQGAKLNLTWQSSANASSYAVCYDTSNDNTCTAPAAWVSAGNSQSLPLSSLQPDTTYYWQVRAVNNISTQYANAGNWWSFRTNKLPAAFQKINSPNGSVNVTDNLDLKWSASTGTIAYEYCLDSNANDSCDSAWKPVPGLTEKIQFLLPNTTYYWQVRTNNNVGSTYADGGTWWSFTTAGFPGVFYKLAPASAAVNQPSNPILGWVHSPGVVSYQYCLDAVIDGSCSGSWANVSTATSAQVRGLLPATRYEWQVRAINTMGAAYANRGVWFTFTTQTAVADFNKKYPGNGASDQDNNIYLDWSRDDANVNYYLLCVDTVNDNICTAPAVWQNVDKNVIPYVGLNEDTIFYWQVRAVNGVGSRQADGGKWWSFASGHFSFSKIGPLNGAKNQPPTPTISWETRRKATSYSYCISTTVNNGNCTASWISTGTATSKVLSGLAPSTTYYWQVMSYDNSSSYPANKNVWWSFTTAAFPGLFGKSTPLNNATGQASSLTLTWQPSAGASGYLLCIDTSNDKACTSPAAWLPVIGTSRLVSGLKANTTYYWQVVAVNSIGRLGANNQAWWAFKTK